ncbi:hypothetical protein [Arcticibacterium luteifluviistationis]|uniref:hypothetical protein n=1 Tax=Arcticibacterium luteifluviistationis TaxID=1784714 RepID=UPI0013A6EAB8|nr:hypothetical protein [Arcticibacterium luteifluviistationis]
MFGGILAFYAEIMTNCSFFPIRFKTSIRCYLLINSVLGVSMFLKAYFGDFVNLRAYSVNRYYYIHASFVAHFTWNDLLNL